MIKRVTHSFCWTGILYVLLAHVAAGIAAGQTPQDRLHLETLRTTTAQAFSRDALQLRRDSLDHVQHPTSQTQLAVGIVELRIGMLTGERQMIDRSVARFGAVIDAEPTWAEPWFDLGRAKLALHLGGFIVKDGPFQRVGVSYATGAANAMMQAIRRDSTFVAAAEALANIVLEHTEALDAADVLPALRTVSRSVSGQSASARASLARGVIERAAGHSDSALASFGRYVELGGDSGVGLLEQARTAFDLGLPERGQESYYAAIQAAASITALAYIRADLAWIATPRELAAFDSSTSATSRSRWAHDFWSERDARDGRASGERLAEHYRRWFYVLRSFRRTIRSNGTAALASGNSPGARLRSQTGLRIIGSDGLETDASKATHEIGAASAATLFEAPGSAQHDMQLSELYARISDQTLLRAFRNKQNLVDDRGVIYMRHGAPVERATFGGDEVDPNESWKYDTPAGPLILHFVGIVAPTTLVEQLALFAPLMASRGSMDRRYDDLAVAIANPARIIVKPEVIRADREAGRRAIAIGTSTDDNALRFERPLAAVVQVMGVREGADGPGRLLIVFAVPSKGLAPSSIGTDSATAYPLRARLILENLASRKITELDTTRRFVTRRRLLDNEFLTGQFRIPTEPGWYHARIVLGDAGWRSGALISRDSLFVPTLTTAGLSMSDIVLGRRGSGQEWIAGTDTVALNPLNAIAKQTPAEIYYQVGGLVRGNTYRTQLEFTRLGGSRPELAIRFEDRATAERTAVTRSVDFSRLRAGQYLLTVTLESQDRTSRTVRHQLLVIVDR